MLFVRTDNINVCSTPRHQLQLASAMPRLFISLVTLSLLALFVSYGTGTVWDRCDLARTLLHKYQLPREQLDSWMCIAWRESRYNSLHINTINTDGSRDYGLFQINNRWWCSNKESPQPNQNMCNVPCETVLESLDETVKCIKTMYAKSKNTWEPWITYPYCQKEDMTQFTKDCEGLEPIPALGGSSHEQYQPAGRPHSRTHHVKHKHHHVKHKHRHEPVKKV